MIFDRELAAAFGINVSAVYTITFVAGAMLGALGGAAMAPKIAVTLGIGVEVIVLAFAVVAIGGMGSIGGAFISALIVGECRAAAVHLAPQVELFVIYAVMAASAHLPAARPVHPRAAAKDLIGWRDRAHPSALLHFSRRGGTRAGVAGLARFARYSRSSQRAGRARPHHPVARRPDAVRASPVLRHRRLCGGADHPLHA